MVENSENGENGGMWVARSVLEPHIIFFLTLSLNLIFYLPYPHRRNLPIFYLLLLELILIFYLPSPLSFPSPLLPFSSLSWFITRTDRRPPPKELPYLFGIEPK